MTDSTRFPPAWVERFWAKVRKSDGCWEWQASTRSFGYGATALHRRSLYAHRVAWELLRGPIPDGLCVLHHCDNPRCCNPDHLYIGTLKQNSQDRERRHRERHNAARGEASGKAKLTATLVRDARHRFSDGTATVRQLADEADVTYENMRLVITGQTWREVLDAERV